jgi:hypothetical protein
MSCRAAIVQCTSTRTKPSLPTLLKPSLNRKEEEEGGALQSIGNIYRVCEGGQSEREMRLRGEEVFRVSRF